MIEGASSEAPAAPIAIMLSMPTDRVTVVRVMGDLDLATAPLLTETVSWLRVIDADRVVVLDTTGVEFIDLAGWRALKDCVDDQAPFVRTPRHVQGVAVTRLEQVIADASER